MHNFQQEYIQAKAAYEVLSEEREKWTTKKYQEMGILLDKPLPDDMIDKAVIIEEEGDECFKFWEAFNHLHETELKLISWGRQYLRDYDPEKYNEYNLNIVFDSKLHIIRAKAINLIMQIAD